MSDISKISPDGTNEYDIKDARAQRSALSTPISVRGTSTSTVEGCLGTLAEAVDALDIYVENNILYLPSKASVSDGVLIIGS